MPVLYYFLIANRDFVDKAFINSEIDIPAEKIDVRHGAKPQKMFSIVQNWLSL